MTAVRLGTHIVLANLDGSGDNGVMPSPPTIDEAAQFCGEVAAAMSETARSPLQGLAAAEIAEHDAKYSDNDVPNAVWFSHEVYEFFLLAAGDFVHGMHLLGWSDTGTTFSTTALARSACEYSAIAWFIARADYSVETRLANAFAAVRGDIQHPGNRNDYGDEGRELAERCERWVSRQSFRIPRGLEKAGPLQGKMFPGTGEEDYKLLSGPIHGQFMPAMRGVQNARGVLPWHASQRWLDVLIATSRGLAAASTVAVTRGDNAADVRQLWLRHRAYSEALSIPQLLSSLE